MAGACGRRRDRHLVGGVFVGDLGPQVGCCGGPPELRLVGRACRVVGRSARLLQRPSWFRRAVAALVVLAIVDPVCLLRILPWQLQREGHAPWRPELVLGRHEAVGLPRALSLPTQLAGAQQYRRAGRGLEPAGALSAAPRPAGLRCSDVWRDQGMVAGGGSAGARVVPGERRGSGPEPAHESGAVDLHPGPAQGAAYRRHTGGWRGHALGGRLKQCDAGGHDPEQLRSREGED
mmetsp:Transcript_10392/g.30150  ORF Transcript_10392/g.30150 Transcript_10392/m.30150 type:complete len:234 (+) Transcript_10392:319-1020(+)